MSLDAQKVVDQLGITLLWEQGRFVREYYWPVQGWAPRARLSLCLPIRGRSHFPRPFPAPWHLPKKAPPSPGANHVQHSTHVLYKPEHYYHLELGCTSGLQSGVKHDTQSAQSLTNLAKSTHCIEKLHKRGNISSHLCDYTHVIASPASTARVKKIAQHTMADETACSILLWRQWHCPGISAPLRDSNHHARLWTHSSNARDYRFPWPVAAILHPARQAYASPTSNACSRWWVQSTAIYTWAARAYYKWKCRFHAFSTKSSQHSLKQASRRTPYMALSSLNDLSHYCIKQSPCLVCIRSDVPYRTLYRDSCWGRTLSRSQFWLELCITQH